MMPCVGSVSTPLVDLVNDTAKLPETLTLAPTLGIGLGISTAQNSSLTGSLSFGFFEAGFEYFWMASKICAKFEAQPIPLMAFFSSPFSSASQKAGMADLQSSLSPLPVLCTAHAGASGRFVLTM